ncbi:MAG: hypothetical protein KA801_08625 [Syntrophorhabdaceae bacterium]|nr:hypothetical protein [Syntrophorhabdaceae bacterium]
MFLQARGVAAAIRLPGLYRIIQPTEDTAQAVCLRQNPKYTMRNLPDFAI